jgi:hypothetical protein
MGAESGGKIKQKRRPTERNLKIKAIMKEHKCTLGEASRYLAEHERKHK